MWSILVHNMLNLRSVKQFLPSLCANISWEQEDGDFLRLFSFFNEKIKWFGSFSTVRRWKNVANSLAVFLFKKGGGIKRDILEFCFLFRCKYLGSLVRSVEPFVCLPVPSAVCESDLCRCFEFFDDEIECIIIGCMRCVRNRLTPSPQSSAAPGSVQVQRCKSAESYIIILWLHCRYGEFQNMGNYANYIFRETCVRFWEQKLCFRHVRLFVTCVKRWRVPTVNLWAGVRRCDGNLGSVGWRTDTVMFAHTNIGKTRRRHYRFGVNKQTCEPHDNDFSFIHVAVPDILVSCWRTKRFENFGSLHCRNRKW